MASQVVTKIELSSLPKLASGKVRDLYEIDDKTLLFLTTDRISAFDVIMANGVPWKGAILTQLTAHWFGVLAERIPGLKTHFLTLAPPAGLSPAETELVRGRSMQVRKLRVFPIEAIVRGYITGSAWSEYQKSGTVHGLPQPAGLQRCSPFPEAIYTPSTKAELGQHDENITPAQAAEIVGERYASRIEALALQVYNAGAAYARERGIIIADTKFEFGLDEETDDIVLIDEVLTPDSSRFWPADEYEVGRDQDSFDKQFLRNWLMKEGLKYKEGVAMPPDVAEATSVRYKDAFKRLAGKTLDEALAELDA
ncbi:putative phosphoribosylaminoimidazole-succinocarboxamide synthase [Lasiosphaeria miniovina]|uniref:Phosphoribosylaminoimidazole-succinocarboxamide synthase n=1 Tax=Lasiosphaeria miniovina TaxID=1954250 RepID=A0AA39ZTJ0_9PEZI|nr:putative phosphoribosylaminoimidazole-succinocarboxamide synthase [Lasiosphaeria miniovina]KAK0703439.1 putative phosphoribosylaminoimidazole-succinocarboxamide synthase [Lasiosphaeria miniovina]